MEPYVHIEDLAKHLSVSVTSVRTWVRQGLIPGHTYIKVGNTYRFCISKVVDALTAGNQQETAVPQPSVDTEELPVQFELDFNNPDQDA